MNPILLELHVELRAIVHQARGPIATVRRAVYADWNDRAAMASLNALTAEHWRRALAFEMRVDHCLKGRRLVLDEASRTWLEVVQSAMGCLFTAGSADQPTDAELGCGFTLAALACADHEYYEALRNAPGGTA